MEEIHAVSPQIASHPVFCRAGQKNLVREPYGQTAIANPDGAMRPAVVELRCQVAIIFAISYAI
jgi:hypothetical protein